MSEAQKMGRVDLQILLQVYRGNFLANEMGMPKGTPYLYSGRSWKRVRALCASGHLKLHDMGLCPLDEMVPVTITNAGIDAYNAHTTKDLS